MASSSGNSSSGSPQIQNSGSELDLRKRKRMESNRESAKRSRMRKQKHLDDLMAQVSQLRKEKDQILICVNVTTEHYVNVEGENSVLRAQMMELTQRLHSLNEILNYINSSTTAAATANSSAATGTGSCVFEADDFENQGFAYGLLNYPCFYNQQGIMASAVMFDY